jgi:uncharacterized membrane protein SirB2
MERWFRRMPAALLLVRICTTLLASGLGSNKAKFVTVLVSNWYKKLSENDENITTKIALLMFVLRLIFRALDRRYLEPDKAKNGVFLLAFILLLLYLLLL